MSYKRLIVCCDGTWQDSDNGFVRDSWLPWKTSGHLSTSSNVTRICRALEPRSQDGIQQVVYYQAGVGTGNNWYSFFLGGYLGEGISENIREAYAFLCMNYEQGDEIILIGFSRGAFTARSIGGLIEAVGLLTRKGLGSFYPIFKDWKEEINRSYKPQYGTSDWPVTRPKFSDPKYMQQLVKDGLTRPSIPIKAIAVWETVGCLGVPEIDIFGIKLFASKHHEYSFIDTEVPSQVEYAYHALALDEERQPYSPTLWESPKPGTGTRLKLLKQTWFPGMHSSVGGGYPDTSVADITLAWLITQLSRHLAFNPAYVLEQRKLNEQYYIDQEVPVASWAMGLIPQSDTGTLNTLLGRKVRTPGEYHFIDPITGKPTEKPLTNTCEFIHPCVRYRIQQNGPGIAPSSTSPPKGTYTPNALAGWTYTAPNDEWRGDPRLGIGKEAEVWDEYGKWMIRRKDGRTTFIVEDRIEPGTEEISLLESWPGVAQKVLN